MAGGGGFGSEVVANCGMIFLLLLIEVAPSEVGSGF